MIINNPPAIDKFFKVASSCIPLEKINGAWKIKVTTKTNAARIEATNLVL